MAKKKKVEKVGTIKAIDILVRLVQYRTSHSEQAYTKIKSIKEKK